MCQSFHFRTLFSSPHGMSETCSRNSGFAEHSLRPYATHSTGYRDTPTYSHVVVDTMDLGGKNNLPIPCIWNGPSLKLRSMNKKSPKYE
jgi:hypothetical protein